MYELPCSMPNLFNSHAFLIANPFNEKTQRRNYGERISRFIQEVIVEHFSCQYHHSTRRPAWCIEMLKMVVVGQARRRWLRQNYDASSAVDKGISRRCMRTKACTRRRSPGI